MAYMCDSEDSTPAAMVITNTETGDVAALCGACVADFMWTFVQTLPDYEDRIKAMMVVMMEREEAASARANKRRRKAGEQEIPTGQAIGTESSDEVTAAEAEA